MKKIHRLILVGPLAMLLLLLSGLIARSQTTPVQVTPQLVAPYSLQVSEYYSGTQPIIKEGGLTDISPYLKQ